MQLPDVIVAYLDGLTPEQESRVLTEAPRAFMDQHHDRCLVMVLDLLHQQQVTRWAATSDALRGYLKSLARARTDGVVDSDDAAEYLERHVPNCDRRLIGAVLKAPHFQQVGYAKSRRRRGMHALWKVA